MYTKRKGQNSRVTLWSKEETGFCKDKHLEMFLQLCIVVFKRYVYTCPQINIHGHTHMHMYTHLHKTDTKPQKHHSSNCSKMSFKLQFQWVLSQFVEYLEMKHILISLHNELIDKNRVKNCWILKTTFVYQWMTFIESSIFFWVIFQLWKPL